MARSLGGPAGLPGGSLPSHRQNGCQAHDSACGQAVRSFDGCLLAAGVGPCGDGQTPAAGSRRVVEHLQETVAERWRQRPCIQDGCSSGRNNSGT
jgi:hypothetical protein